MSHDIDVAIHGNWPSPFTIQLECSGCGWTKNMGITTSPEAIAEAESQHLFDVMRSRIEIGYPCYLRADGTLYSWAPPDPAARLVWSAKCGGDRWIVRLHPNIRPLPFNYYTEAAALEAYYVRRI